MKRFKNILYVNEPTVDQTSAVARAVSLAENNQADLTIVDVIPTKAVTARLHRPEGPAKEIIAPLAAEFRADLVVMGTVARTGIMVAGTETIKRNA